MATRKNHAFTNDLICSTTRASLNSLTNGSRFKKIDPNALSLLTDITISFMFKVSRETAKLRHLINSNITSVDDVIFTLQDFNMQIPDIHRFMTSTQMIVPPINLPVFPVNTIEPQKEYELTEKEKLYREANEIPDFLPPIWPVVVAKKKKVVEEEEAVVVAAPLKKPSKVLIRPITKNKIVNRAFEVDDLTESQEYIQKLHEMKQAAEKVEEQKVKENLYSPPAVVPQSLPYIEEMELSSSAESLPNIEEEEESLKQIVHQKAEDEPMLEDGEIVSDDDDDEFAAANSTIAVVENNIVKVNENIIKVENCNEAIVNDDINEFEENIQRMVKVREDKKAAKTKRMYEAVCNDHKRKSESKTNCEGKVIKKSKKESTNTPNTVSTPKPRQPNQPISSLDWGNYKIPKKEALFDASEANVSQMPFSTLSSPATSISTLSPASTRDHQISKGYTKRVAFPPQLINPIRPSSISMKKKLNPPNLKTTSASVRKRKPKLFKRPHSELLNDGLKLVIRFPKAQ